VPAKEIKRFVLFDIDGTLIDPGGVGRRSVTQAFNTVLFISDAFAGITMDGKTDIQIIKEGLGVHGVPAHIPTREILVLSRILP